MIVADFVQVAPQSTGRKIDNTKVSISGHDVLRQITAAGDPEDPAAYGRVRNSLPGATDYGVVTRVPAPGYDSDVVTLPDTLTALTTDTIRAKGVLLCNLTSTQKLVTLTDTAGTERLKEFPLQGRMTTFIPLGDITMVGVKWNADAAASVNAQLVGDK